MLLTPSKATLKKYGLTEDAWRTIADAQGHACFVCEQEPTKGRLCIDHDHVKGWSKMPPELRARYVRGILCFRCNTTYVGRSITVRRAQRVVEYLTQYLGRSLPNPKNKTSTND